MKRLVGVALLATLALTACSDEHANDKCVKSHKTHWLMPVLVGKTTVLIPETGTVCDKWVPKGGK